MARDDYLFSKYDWFSFQDSQLKKLEDEIAGWDGNRLLNTSVEDLCKYFVEKHRINIPVLNMDEITVDYHEAQVDVSRDPYRIIIDRSQPVYVSGTEIEITVPFTGDFDGFMFRLPAYELNPLPPRGTVRDGILTFSVKGTNLKDDEVRKEINSTLERINNYLTTLRGKVNMLHNELDSTARQCIKRCREKLLADQNLVASLGFKLKQRTDSPKTYTAPEVRRKIILTPPQASSMPYKPEPALDEAEYEHILEVIENMAQVMERSPSAFSEMAEESLRSHFLVQLNGHYEGQATGETFNYEGKTDILIRSEGKNIFIAECKYWAGPQKLTDAIDQLLGYSS